MKFCVYFAVIGAAYGWDYDSKVEVKWDQAEGEKLQKDYSKAIEEEN